MRVLWLTAVLHPEVAPLIGQPVPSWGGWISSLADELARRDDLRLALATMVPLRPPSRHSVAGIEHYVLPCAKEGRTAPLRADTVAAFRRAIEQFQPHLIHFYGTEWSHGLLALRHAPGIPHLLSVQGLTSVIGRYCRGGLGLWECIRYRTIQDCLRLSGLLEEPWLWRRRARTEIELLRQVSHADGRTLFEKSHIQAINPRIRFHQVPRVLRKVFYRRRWDLAGAKRHTILVSSATPAYKGLHVLLEAAALLKAEFPDLQIRAPLFPPTCAGDFLRRHLIDGYSKYLKALVARYQLQDNVAWLGRLRAEQMAEEMLGAHVFSVPSFVDSSPNALSEAMILGVPCTASLVGGIPWLCTDEVDALCHPSGDAAVLAEQIRRIFNDDALALRLSASARRRAQERNDPQTIVAKLLSAYREVRTTS